MGLAEGEVLIMHPHRSSSHETTLPTGACLNKRFRNKKRLSQDVETAALF